MILARNEERNIGHCFEALARQTLFAKTDVETSLYVGANGCSDRTVQIAQEFASKTLEPLGITIEIFDWDRPGKSRSWNRLVHDVLPSGLDYVLAMDADIEFADEFVLANMLDAIQDDPQVDVLSGSPTKDSVRKVRPNLIDRFSNSVSRLTAHSTVINGSLYLAKAACLSGVWLPDETPGEDGFLNAMVATRGFSRAAQPELVKQLSRPTHYFESHSPTAFFAHEKRMIVGTMINRWIFEYLLSLRLAEPAGPLIDRLNRTQPDWVDKIIAERGSRRWLIPRALLFRRLAPKHGLTANYLIRLPILALATALTIVPAITANRALKQRGAAVLW